MEKNEYFHNIEILKIYEYGSSIMSVVLSIHPKIFTNASIKVLLTFLHLVLVTWYYLRVSSEFFLKVFAIGYVHSSGRKGAEKGVRGK